MNKDYKMEENNFKEVRDILKALPRISAPDDFDNELKRKLIALQNVPKKRKLFAFPFRRALIPAAAFGLTSIILFFVFSGGDQNDINPFILSPDQRIQSGLNSDNNSPIKVNSQDVVINENKIEVIKEETQPVSDKLREKENNDIYKNRIRELLVNSEFNNVDRSLQAKPEKSAGFNSRGATVNFNGFNIIQENDPVIEELRARMDSIKKFMRENDKK